MRALVFFFVLILPLNLLAAEFEIFTLGIGLVDNPNATVYYVDQGDRLLESINQDMRAAGIKSEEQGKPYATPELSDALVNQVRGLLKAAHYQLKYFPAVVVDGQYVIYGTTDTSMFKEMKP